MLLAIIGLSTLATASGIFHSDDFMIPLVKGEIDVSKINSVYNFHFINKRKGNHTIGISVKKLPEGQHYHFYKTSFAAEISVFNGSELLMRTTVNKPLTAYWGGYNRIGGFDLLWYKVPTDLPLGTPLTCSIKLIKGDPEFESTYGKGEYFLIKASDK